MLNRELIYNASQEEFFQDVRLNTFADTIAHNFKESFGRNVHDSEFNSWVVTGDKIKNLLESSHLSTIYVAFEYQVPYTQQRIDCLLFGKNENGKRIMVHIEMKQWQKVEALDIEGNFLETYVGGGTRKQAHPSQQVEGYHDYLFGFIEVFEEKKIGLIGCSYCPNYRKKIGEGLFNSIYKTILEKYPVYTHEDAELLSNRLNELLCKGKG